MPAEMPSGVHLGLLCAQLAIVRLAQVVSLGRQLPLLVLKISTAQAAVAVAATTASSLLGRLLMAGHGVACAGAVKSPLPARPSCEVAAVGTRIDTGPSHRSGWPGVQTNEDAMPARTSAPESLNWGNH